MSTQSDADLMARAIELSKLGYPAPNPHVGCLIVRDGEVVGEGFHDYAGGPHAEVVALEGAGTRARCATAYVSLEPCNHQGRTGPCSLALIDAGIAKVIYAASDPNPRAQGGGERLSRSGVVVEAGLLAEQAMAANELWATAMRRQWPFVVVKAAVTRNGMIARSNRQSKWITGIESRKEAHRLRAECGAVLVGRGTVEADNPELTVRHIEVVNKPLRIVLDAQRRLSTAYKIFDEAAPTLRVVARDADEGEMEVSTTGAGFDLHELLRKLFQKGVTSLLVEGGAETISRFLEADLVDRIDVFIADFEFDDGLLWSGDIAEPLRDWKMDKTTRLGSDVWNTYRLKRA
jgi:diaminohydroxyphosphoribosylaminopyrimidine deaminase/5-amino-6-(5-phosphoribosylamino)uracil reductase